MKNRGLLFGSVFMLALAAAAPSAALGEVRLIVNNHLIEGAYLEDGKTLAPVRQVADALGAGIGWNAQDRTVTVVFPDVKGMELRIAQLERALAPTSPEDAARKYAEGVKTRNGALQYAVLSPNLREEKREVYESMNWVTGTSSPWVESYQIQEEKLDEKKYRFTIRFVWADSTGARSQTAETVTVEKREEGWTISELAVQE